MKKLLIFLSVAIISCEKGNEGPEIVNTPQVVPLTNLLPNPSFELNGLPSFISWNYVNAPAGIDTFSLDVPSNGGTYSLILEPQWLPAEGAVETYVTGITGNYFQLTFDAKCLNVVTPEAYASVYIKGVTLSSVQSLNFVNTQWTSYVLNTPLLPVTATDTLVVKLSASSTEVANWRVLFDNVQLFSFP